MTTWLDDDPERYLYPESDGNPVADDTRQFEWIAKMQGALDGLFCRDPDGFVAADLFWYPVRGEPTIRAAPDTMVVFGRPKGHRHSYRQWSEGGVAPQVVFEIQSPNDRPENLTLKYDFYDRYGVEEYYLYDPKEAVLSGWMRDRGRLRPLPALHDWVSPRLGVRFDLSGEELVIHRPDGTRFLTFLELEQRRQEAMVEAEKARRQAECLTAQLRALGVEPEA